MILAIAIIAAAAAIAATVVAIKKHITLSELRLSAEKVAVETKELLSVEIVNIEGQASKLEGDAKAALTAIAARLRAAL